HCLVLGWNPDGVAGSLHRANRSTSRGITERRNPATTTPSRSRRRTPAAYETGITGCSQRTDRRWPEAGVDLRGPDEPSTHPPAFNASDNAAFAEYSASNKSSSDSTAVLPLSSPID